MGGPLVKAAPSGSWFQYGIVMWDQCGSVKAGTLNKVPLLDFIQYIVIANWVAIIEQHCVWQLAKFWIARQDRKSLQESTRALPRTAIGSRARPVALPSASTSSSNYAMQSLNESIKSFAIVNIFILSKCTHGQLDNKANLSSSQPYCWVAFYVSKMLSPTSKHRSNQLPHQYS